jgi:hypothetical protein
MPAMDSMVRRSYIPSVSATQVPLSGMAAALIGLAALGATVFGWSVVRHFTVMAHEGAHAVTGTLLMRNFHGIDLNSDATGKTDIRPATGFGGGVTFFAGYVGPSLFGLGAAKLIEHGRIAAVLWVLLFLLAVLLISLNRSFGIITVILAGGLVYLVGRYTPMAVQIVVAYAVTWLLLVSGVWRVLEVNWGSRDGGNLRRMTHIPRFLWFLLWLAGTLTAVAAGGKWLVLRS